MKLSPGEVEKYKRRSFSPSIKNVNVATNIEMEEKIAQAGFELD